MLQHSIKQETPQKKTVGGKEGRTVEAQILIPPPPACMVQQNVGLAWPTVISNNQFCPSCWRISHTTQSYVTVPPKHRCTSTLLQYAETHRHEHTQAVHRMICKHYHHNFIVLRIEIKHFNDSAGMRACQAAQPQQCCCWFSFSSEQKNEKHTEDFKHIPKSSHNKPRNAKKQKLYDFFNGFMNEGRQEMY